MSEPSSEDPLVRFRSVVAQRFGLALEPSRIAGAVELLERRAAARGMDVRAYVEHVEGDVGSELAALIPELTVSETYFFRHSQQFDALLALLASSAAEGAKAGPRLLCAGCATGEEAFSLAILLRETAPLRTPSILAVDLNAAVLARAQQGKFSAWALRETPAFRRARWFRQEGAVFHLDPSIRDSVKFCQANLAAPDPIAFAPAAYDVIFCRNVLMYFTPEQSRAAIARLHDALTPGGYLFLGSAETLRDASQDFDVCQAHGAFYYRKRAPDRARSAPSALERSRWCGDSAVRDVWSDSQLAAAASHGEPNAEWTDNIARAAARVVALSGSGKDRGTAAVSAPAEERARGPSSPLGARSDLREPLELLGRERFDAALSRVRELSAERAADGDVLLLEAVLLSSGGQLEAARSACERLLSVDELNAGAHYVLALCDAAKGAVDAAVRHHRIATYLDPHFAMPRLQLGLLLRRAGQNPQARSELMHAQALLEHEDPERLALFGGGFGRGALLELCASELAAAEENA